MRARLFLLLVTGLWTAFLALPEPCLAQGLLQTQSPSTEQAQNETMPATRPQVEAFKLELNQIEIGQSGIEQRLLRLIAVRDIRVENTRLQSGDSCP